VSVSTAAGLPMTSRVSWVKTGGPGLSSRAADPQETSVLLLLGQKRGRTGGKWFNWGVASWLQVNSWGLVPLPALLALDNTPQPSELPAELVHALQGGSYSLPLGLLQGPHTQTLPNGTAAAAGMAMVRSTEAKQGAC
jgi:hypothetical protein